MMAQRELQEDRPPSGRVAALSALLGLLALLGVGAAIAITVTLLFFVDNFTWNSAGGRRTIGLLTVNLLIGVAALWGLKRITPWTGKGEPVSPTTRRALACCRPLTQWSSGASWWWP